MSTKLIASLLALCSLGSLAPAQRPLSLQKGSPFAALSSEKPRHEGGARRGVAVGRQARALAAEAEQLRQMYAREKTGNFFKKASWQSAYGAIEVFGYEARRFQGQVKRQVHRPGVTRTAYARLLSSWEQVERALPGAHHFGRVRLQYRSLRDAVTDLGSLCAMTPPRPHRVVEIEHRHGPRPQGRALSALARSIRAHAAQLELGYAREKTGNFFSKGSWRRAQAAISRFREEADHLASSAARPRAHRGLLRGDFVRLVEAWDRVEATLPGAHHFGRVRARFAQLGDEVLELREHFDVAVAEPRPRMGPRFSAPRR